MEQLLQFAVDSKLNKIYTQLTDFVISSINQENFNLYRSFQGIEAPEYQTLIVIQVKAEIQKIFDNYPLITEYWTKNENIIYTANNWTPVLILSSHYVAPMNIS